MSRPVFASVLATSSSWRTSTARCSTRIGGSTSATSPGVDAERDGGQRAHADGGHLERVVVPAADQLARSRAARWCSAIAAGDEHVLTTT